MSNSTPAEVVAVSQFMKRRVSMRVDRVGILVGVVVQEARGRDRTRSRAPCRRACRRRSPQSAGVSRCRRGTCARRLRAPASSAASASADRWSASRSTVSLPSRSASSSAEHLGVVRIAQQVHRLLGVLAGIEQSCAHAGGPLAPRRQLGRRLRHAFVEQFVEQDRMRHEVVGRPAARAEQAQHARERLRILREQRHVRAAAADHVDEAQEAQQRPRRA